MTTLTPTSLAALEALETALPASPKDIPADISLDNLQDIRAGWLAQARAQGIPEKLFEILEWLGNDIPSRREGIHKEYKIGGVRITGSIETDVFVPASNKWNTYRHLWVCVDGKAVCTWNWHYLTNAIDDPISNKQDAGNSDELLYIPGAWVASALALQPRAEAARIGIARNAELVERDRLARRLLVGQSV
jgi:hypothetical protein